MILAQNASGNKPFRLNPNLFFSFLGRATGEAVKFVRGTHALYFNSFSRMIDQ